MGKGLTLRKEKRVWLGLLKKKMSQSTDHLHLVRNRNESLRLIPNPECLSEETSLGLKEEEV